MLFRGATAEQLALLRLDLATCEQVRDARVFAGARRPRGAARLVEGPGGAVAGQVAAAPVCEYAIPRIGARGRFDRHHEAVVTVSKAPGHSRLLPCPVRMSLSLASDGEAEDQ